MKSAEEILTSVGKFRINLGLDRMEKILKLLNNPEKNLKFIHIAGTNGKGSTSKIINDILIEHFKNQNIKIGLFVSPHLFSYCERMKINNENIKEDIFSKLINDINNLAIKNNIDLTEFELICASAFYYFYLEKTDYVVLEVGLGGLYDATNVIKNTLVSVITEIDFDHTERLGNTLSEIAYQKAGIIKNNSKVAVLESNLGFETIKKEALLKKAQILKAPEVKIEFLDFENNFAYIENEKIKFNLLGSHQKDNLALALCAINSLNLNISTEAIKKALKKIKWDFRLEYVKNKNLLIDGAHNPSGILTLKKFLKENIKEDITYIFGCLNNKDYNKMLEILLEDKKEFFFFEFNYPNALKYNELPDKFKKRAKKLSSIKEVQNIVNTTNFKVICGSLYMLGQVFKHQSPKYQGNIL